MRPYVQTCSMCFGKEKISAKTDYVPLARELYKTQNKIVLIVLVGQLDGSFLGSGRLNLANTPKYLLISPPTPFHPSRKRKTLKF